MNSGIAGIAFSSKDMVFEPNAQSSSNASQEEISKEFIGITVQNIIAVPLFNSVGESIGVYEILNSDPSFFQSPNLRPMLMKFAKYISLLFYTNELLKVFSLA